MDGTISSFIMNVSYVVSEVTGPQDPGLERPPGTEVLINTCRLPIIIYIHYYLLGRINF
jgi:hypothetical protein